jgi:hypothetical protein
METKQKVLEGLGLENKKKSQPHMNHTTLKHTQAKSSLYF